jgi:hypothetical protein
LGSTEGHLWRVELAIAPLLVLLSTNASSASNDATTFVLLPDLRFIARPNAMTSRWSLDLSIILDKDPT